MLQSKVNFKYYSRLIILFLIISPTISYGQGNEPTASETAEWIILMLNHRCSVHEDAGYLEYCIQTDLLSAKKLSIGLSNLAVITGQRHTIVKTVYEVEFGLLDPDNIEVTPTKIILKTTNGIKSIKRTEFHYDMDGGFKLLQLSNVNLIKIQINGKNLAQSRDKAEWIDISRVKNAFENIIRMNGGKKSTIEWKSDEELKQDKIKEVKKRY